MFRGALLVIALLALAVTTLASPPSPAAATLAGPRAAAGAPPDPPDPVRDHAPAPGRVTTAATAPAAVAVPRRGSVFRLYRAVFERDPDLGGLLHWEGRHFVAGVPLSSIAERFTDSSEFRNTYGPLSDPAFVDLVYRNVMDRDADAGGRRYWIDRLRRGLGRGRLMIGFSESSEYVRRTASGATPRTDPAPEPPDSGLPPAEDWLGWVNLHRSGAGLDTISADTAWSRGAELHARYAVHNQDFGNDEDPSLPHYTPAGQAAAQSGNLYAATSALSRPAVIGGWLNSTAHGAWMVNPRWERSGYGEFHDPDPAEGLRWAALLDVLRGAPEPEGPPELVRFPGPGQAARYRPEKLFVIFPEPSIDTALAASVTVDGREVGVSVAPTAYGGYPSRTVVVTLDEAITAPATVIAEVSAGDQETNWSFTVAAVPPEPPRITATATPSGLLAVTLTPARANGAAVTAQVAELWEGGALVERQVTASGRRPVFFHSGVPDPGAEIRVYAQSAVGRGPTAVFRV